MTDRFYTMAVNSYIPHAAREADARVAACAERVRRAPGKDGVPYAFCLWTEYFHEAMNHMTMQDELRSGL